MTDPLDLTLAASLRRMALNERRARGDSCPTCDDLPYLPDDSDTVTACPTCGLDVGTVTHRTPPPAGGDRTTGIAAARSALTRTSP